MRFRGHAKPKFEAVREAAVVVWRGQQVFFRRAAGERWAGLWDFVRFPLRSGKPAPRTMQTELQQQCDLHPRRRGNHHAQARRDTLSHHAGLLRSDPEPAARMTPGALAWVLPEELAGWP